MTDSNQPNPPTVWHVVPIADGVRRSRIPRDVANAIRSADYETLVAIRDAVRDELLSRQS